MRIAMFVSALVLLTATVQAQPAVQDTVSLPSTSVRRETRRAMLGYGALGLGGSLVLSAGLGLAIGFGIPPRGREDPLPAFAGMIVGASTFAIAAPTFTAMGFERGGRKDDLRGGIGPAWGATFGTLMAGGVLTTGLMFAPIDHRTARAVLVVMPAATLSSALGFGYLAYRRRDRLRRLEASAPRAFVAPSLSRDAFGVTALLAF